MMPSQVELDFRAQAGGQSQNQKLAVYLRDNPDRWIPMPELARIITPTGIGAAVHSRIADLRTKFGMTIVNESRLKPGGRQRESFYRYKPNSPSNGTNEAGNLPDSG